MLPSIRFHPSALENLWLRRESTCALEGVQAPSFFRNFFVAKRTILVHLRRLGKAHPFRRADLAHALHAPDPRARMAKFEFRKRSLLGFGRQIERAPVLANDRPFLQVFHDVSLRRQPVLASPPPLRLEPLGEQRFTALPCYSNPA